MVGNNSLAISPIQWTVVINDVTGGTQLIDL